MSRFIRLETDYQGVRNPVIINIDHIESISPNNNKVFMTSDFFNVTPESMVKLLKEVGCDE